MSIRTVLSKVRLLSRRSAGPHLVLGDKTLGYNRVCHLADFAHPASGASFALSVRMR